MIEFLEYITGNGMWHWFANMLTLFAFVCWLVLIAASLSDRKK